MQDKDKIIALDIKELREETGYLKDYDIDKPGTQDMDGNTTFYITTSNDMIEAIQNLSDNDEIKIDSNISTADINSDIVLNKNIIMNVKEGITLTSGNGINDNIKVLDSTVMISGKGTINSNDPYDKNHSTTIISVNENGHLILDDGIKINSVMDDAVNKGQFGIGIFENGKLTINDVEITAGWYCISSNNLKTTADAITTINNGNLTSTVDYAIYHPHAGNLIINGGTITGGAGAISMNMGNLTINGGILKTTGDGNTGDWSDGTSGQTPAVINLNGKYGIVNCEINGGTFIAMNNAPIVITGTKYPVNIKIKGGKFSQKPNTDWIAEGYAVTDTPDEDNFYVVYKI